LKANFKIKKNNNTDTNKTIDTSNEERNDVTEVEFEDYLGTLKPGWNLWPLRSKFSKNGN